MLSPPEQDARLRRARSILLLDHPWFGSLALRLALEPDPAAETAATDGATLAYAPDWIAQRTAPELLFVVAHEVMHCALGHIWRQSGRDHTEWNIACDYVVNQVLIDAHVGTPAPGALYDRTYRGMAAEQVYALRQRMPTSQRPQPSCPQPQMRRPPKPQAGAQPAAKPPTATDWQIAAGQATLAAQRAGHGAGSADRAAKAARESQTDWRTLLRQFVENIVPSGTSWAHPNRRHVHAGLYLPGPLRENTPPLGIAVDTSGSIGPADLAMFAAELTNILHEVRPERLDVVYCDSCVQGTETFTPDENPDVVLHARGGGGTAFQPALDWFIRAGERGEEPPAAVIYLTDLGGPRSQEPEYSVLWCVPAHVGHVTAPFGELVRIDAYS